jgi:hypothetical protein
MHRSLLQPIRTCRVIRTESPQREDSNADLGMTPGTRKTLAAIGALWVAFATSSAVATSSDQLVAARKTGSEGRTDSLPQPDADLDKPWSRSDGCSPWRETCSGLGLLEGDLDTAGFATHEGRKKLISQ